ncbi:uncharacterized protein LOC126996399 isoform X3 [Eriocheir sinensis]|uniref:uncharacterized protein LOC126996399 isoform X3 n=1 Tax=Eriocheir sinensis TaxID=95602 RepID=UPI0021C8C449|nr:uncharacterized protein LOC126996399 isoform X3 [Eriocheir sinensis]
MVREAVTVCLALGTLHRSAFRLECHGGGHHPAPLTTAAKTSAMSCLPSPLLSCRPPHRTLTSSWQRLGMHKATHCSSSVVFPSDLPTTVLLIKLVEEGDSAMGTVMLLNFLNAWKVQELTSRPGEPSDHTLQDSLLILGHTQPHPSGRRLTANSECRAADGGPGNYL